MTFLFGDDYYKTFTQIAKESGFRFNLYRGRIDWKKLDVLDVDRIVRDIDVEMLNIHVNNVINCNFDIEYDVKILDPSFVKLFRIAQLTIDFLLHCKHYFEQKLRDTVVELEAAKQETEELRKHLNSKSVEIKQLKKNLKQKIKKDKNSFSISPGLRSINVQCNMCGKVFIDDTYLQAHLARRHAGQRLLGTIDHTTFLQQEIKELKNRLQSAEMRLYNENCVQEEKEEQVIESEQQTITKNYQDEIKQLKDMFFSEMQKLKQNTVKINETEKVSLLENQPEKHSEKKLKQNTVKINETEKVSFLENQPEKHSEKGVDQVYLDLNKSNKQTDEDLIQNSKNSWEEKLEARETVWRARLSTMDQEHKKELRELHAKLKSSHEESLRLKSDFEKQFQEAMLKIEENRNKEIKNLDHQATDNKVICTPPEVTTKNAIEVIEKIISIDKDPNENNPQPASLIKRKAFVHQKTIERVPEILQENIVKRSGDTISNFKDIELENNEDNLGKHIESKVIRLLKPKIIDRSVTLVNEEKSNISLREDFSETVVEYKDTKENLESVDFSNIHDVNSNTSDETSEESESDMMQDESESSESDSQEEGYPTLQKELTLQSLQSMEDILASNPEILKELKTDLIQLLDRRLQELCIDPEWTGVPNKTFKTKMAVLKHHQKITAKHHTGYFTLRDHLLQNLEDRCVTKSDENKPTPKQNILTRLHKKAVQVIAMARPNLGLAKKGNSKPHATLVEVNNKPHRSIARESKSTIKESDNDSNIKDKPQTDSEKSNKNMSIDELQNFVREKELVESEDLSDPLHEFIGQRHKRRPAMDFTLTRTRSEFVLTSSSENEELKSPLNGNQPVQIYKSAMRSASSTGNLTKKKVVFLDELFSGNKKSFSDDMMNVTPTEACATPTNSATSLDRIQSLDNIQDQPNLRASDLTILNLTSVVHSTPRSDTLQLPKLPSPSSSLTSIGSSLLDISPTEGPKDKLREKSALEWNLEDIEENLKSD